MTLLCPLFGLFGGFYESLRHNRTKASAFCFALFLASFAYGYTPIDKEVDLFEYFQNMKNLANVSFFEIFSVNSMNVAETLPLSVVMQWLFAKTGDFNLLPSFTVFVIYFIGFYIANVLFDDLGIDNFTRCIFLLFLLLCPNFAGIVNNIRNIFSFSLFLLAVFRDCYQNRHGCLTVLLYVCPLFIHTATFVLLFLRLALPLIGHYKLLFLILSICGKYIVDFLYGQIGMLPDWLFVFKLVIVKAYRYFNSSSEFAVLSINSGSYLLARCLYITIAVLFCFIACFLLRKGNGVKLCNYFGSCEQKNRLNNIVLYDYACGLMTISCWAMLLPEYWRFASVFLLGSSSIFLTNAKLYRKKYFVLANYIAIAFVIPCALIWIRSFIRTDLIRVVLASVLGSPVTISFNLILNILS